MYVDLLYAKRDIYTMKKTSTLIKFGNKVKQLRLGKGWSQEALSLKSGFHRTYIGMIERAERNISLNNIERIAKTFNLRIKDLFKD